MTESPSTSQVDESFEDSTADVKAVDSQVIDLDTRLKMLMKDKTGAMPAFLLQELNSGSGMPVFTNFFAQKDPCAFLLRKVKLVLRTSIP